MDYANGKIYKITGGGMTYYGSTTQPLSKRFYSHKYLKKCSSNQIIETGEAVIVLIELFPCKSKEELFSRERYYIENNDCVNKNIPMRTQKEYRIENADKIKERSKEYYIDNKERSKQYYIDNKEQKKQYRIDNKEQKKQYYIENVDKIKEQKKQYRIENADKIKEQKKQYYLKKKR
jgi:hypothetical protein